MGHRDFPPYRAADFAPPPHLLRRVPPWCWAERTALWWGYDFQGGPRVVRLRTGVRMLIEPRRLHVDYAYVLPRDVRAPLPPARRGRLLGPGGTMLDVGANIGLYSLYCRADRRTAWPGSRRGRGGPPDRRGASARNVARNGFATVSVVEMAAGAAEGVITLGLPEGGTPAATRPALLAGVRDEARVASRIDDLLVLIGVTRVRFPRRRWTSRGRSARPSAGRPACSAPTARRSSSSSTRSPPRGGRQLVGRGQGPAARRGLSTARWSAGRAWSPSATWAPETAWSACSCPRSTRCGPARDCALAGAPGCADPLALARLSVGGITERRAAPWAAPRRRGAVGACGP